MPNDIGPKIGVQGEGEFRKEIASINTSLKTMGAEMDKVTSSFIGNEKSVEALTAKNELLGARFDELSKKADVQRARLKELDDQGVDPSSASYQKLLQDLYKTEAAMNKTEAEIIDNAKAMNGLDDETTDAAKAMDEGGKSASRFGDLLKANLASEAIKAGIHATVEAIKAVGQAALDAAASADDLATLSTQTGIATDELQKMQYAAGVIDVDVSTLTGSMAKLTKNMSSAASGSGAAADAFAKLGVTVTNDDGTFRDRNEVFQDAIKALGEMSDEVDRDATAMAIFGKSAQDLNPLIMGGAEALQELGDHAEEAGLILSGDSVKTLANLNDSFTIMQQTASMAGQQFLVQFAEPITGAIETVTGYIEKLLAAFQEGGLGALGDVVGEIASDITAKVTEWLPGIADFAVSAIETLATGLISQLPTIVKSAVTVITTLVSGLAAMLPDLIPVAVDAILTLVDTLTDPETLGNLIDAAIEIVIALADGLIDALPKLLEKAPEIIANLVTALVENIPKLVMAAFDIMGGLVTGLIDNLPQLGQAAGQIIDTLLEGLASLWASMLDVGRNIVEGIWEGISGMAEWLWSKVTGFFDGIVGGIKGLLGIHSPSTVFAGIGDNMAEGIGVGFDRTMDRVERDMMSSMQIPTVDVGMGAAQISGMGGTPGMVEEITIPVEVGGVELARVLYRHIVGEGQRIGAAAVG